MEIQEKALYTVGQAAEILSRSPESIRRMVRLGYLPGRNIGRRVYILGSDLLGAGTVTQVEPEPQREPEPEPEPEPERKRGRGKSAKTMSAGDRWRAMVSMRASGAGPE